MAARHPRALTPWMTDLHPQMTTPACASLGQTPKLLQTAVAVTDDVARPFEIASINLDVSRERETYTPFGPTAVQGLVSLGSPVIRIGQTFRHG
jgi:hypothetical protein